MKKHILSIALVFAALIGSVRGQSANERNTASQAPNGEALKLPESNEQRNILFTKEGRRPLAENAEDAETEEALKRPSRYWGRSEFLLWWLKAPNIPTLVTMGDYTDLPTPGALDTPGTSVIFGGDRIQYQDRGGGRFTVGYWLADEHSVGVEAGYFFLTGRTISRSVYSPGTPVLANPFFNVLTNLQDASLISYPGISSGTVTADTRSFLQGFEGNISANLRHSERCRVEALGGFRWLNLNERININSVSVVDIAQQFQGKGLPFNGNTISVRDGFETRNHFYGGQLGARVELSHNRFTFGLVGKVALGVTHEIVTIRGSTDINTTPATTQNAGLYALSSNSGRHTTNSLAFVPETGATLKFQLTERIDLFGGYSFLYWSRVARPGDQIDLNINPNLVPTSSNFGAGGVNQPGFRFRHTDFFAHGANFGVELRY